MIEDMVLDHKVTLFRDGSIIVVLDPQCWLLYITQLNIL